MDDEEEVLLVVGLLDEVLGEAVSKPVRKFLLADVRGRIHASENSATNIFKQFNGLLGSKSELKIMAH